VCRQLELGGVARVGICHEPVDLIQRGCLGVLKDQRRPTVVGRPTRSWKLGASVVQVSDARAVIDQGEAIGIVVDPERESL